MTIAVTSDDPEHIRALVVEDDDDMATYLAHAIERNPAFSATVVRATTLGDTIELISELDVDVVMLDLGLPDADGLAVVRRVLDSVPSHTAIVVVTAERDLEVTTVALRLGVQDYIVKHELSPGLVSRVVRHAVARTRMQAALEEARRGADRERELRRLERMSMEGSTTRVAARMLGERTVAEQMGERYERELLGEYVRLIEESLEERVYRNDGQVDVDLRSLATLLGFLGAGPRDVVEMHSRAMRRVVEGADARRGSAAVEEGRLLLVKLLGRLVTYYRARSLGSGRPEPGSAPDHERAAVGEPSNGRES